MPDEVTDATDGFKLDQVPPEEGLKAIVLP